MPSSPPDIVLIGAGNVGFHLGKRLSERGMSPVQVYSRSEAKALRLAETIDCSFTTRLEAVHPGAGLYILAVRDEAIGPVARRLTDVLPGDPLFVHTSGATPAAAIGAHHRRHGVFYPLQTFSIDREVAFGAIPLCVFAPREEDLQLLRNVASRISSSVYEVDDEQRAVLHVAAVFVNNFTNHLYGAGKDILDQEGLPFDLLRPLIRETAEKVQAHSPQQMQTGPAVRGDQATIDHHQAYLGKFPAYRELYRLLTVHIQQNEKAN